MRKVVLSTNARLEIAVVLGWSQLNFEVMASSRYATLIQQAITDLAIDPHRIGSKWVESAGSAVGLYHIDRSRGRVASRSDRVRRARHILIYQVPDETSLVILGLIHDAMDQAAATQRAVAAIRRMQT